MNSKRRADLQRKLSMGAVPRPPAGLAERIKADIPKYLAAHPAPERFSWSNTLRVAASVLLLLTTALVTRELLEPRGKEAPSTAAKQLTPAVLRYEDRPRAAADSTAAATATTTQAETEVSLDFAEEIPLPSSATAAAAPPPPRIADAEMAVPQTANEAVRREESPARLAGAFAGADASADAAASAPAPVQVAEAAAPPPPPPAVSAPAPAPARSREVAARSFTITAQAPAIVAEAHASTLQFEPTSVFGISVDPNAFPAVRTAIETGERPAPGIVNVEALVNYFAGAKAPRRDVALEVEASPAPIAVERDDRAILRFSVDTAAVAVPARGSVPPVARDARLHIEIDPRAVATFRRIGEGEPASSESALLHNTSVTGLYELSLKPNLRASQRVATVTLRYVSVKTGRPQSIARVIHGHDLARTWERASRRHRLAALGAIWSETLKGTNGGSEIAKRAQELATQNPRDSRARELANAASASNGGAP